MVGERDSRRLDDLVVENIVTKLIDLAADCASLKCLFLNSPIYEEASAGRPQFLLEAHIASV